MLNDNAFDLRRFISRNPQSIAVWVALLVLILFGLLRYDNFGGAYNITSFLNYNAMFIGTDMGQPPQPAPAEEKVPERKKLEP